MCYVIVLICWHEVLSHVHRQNIGQQLAIVGLQMLHFHFLFCKLVKRTGGGVSPYVYGIFICELGTVLVYILPSGPTFYLWLGVSRENLCVTLPQSVGREWQRQPQTSWVPAPSAHSMTLSQLEPCPSINSKVAVRMFISVFLQTELKMKFR